VIERSSRCPGCTSAVPARAVALEYELKCPTCRTPLRVALVYQANFALASFVLGLLSAYFVVGPDRPYFVPLTFLLAFVFAVFLGTTVVPLVPPRLDTR
jgi:hypothetical protein